MNGTCVDCGVVAPVSMVYPDKTGKRDALCATCVTGRDVLVTMALYTARRDYRDGRLDLTPRRTDLDKYSKAQASHFTRAYRTTVQDLMDA